MLTIVLVLTILFQFGLVCWLLFKKTTADNITQPKATNTPQTVGSFYNQTTDNFLAVYGEIIQAFRTNNVEDYLNYTIQSMQLKDGMKAIDAGCGVCGPACHFATVVNDLKIDAITVSEVQFEKSRAKIDERNLQNQVHVRIGDYHKLNEIFKKESADRVYFLESFGHSNDKRKVIKAAYDVLKPGGKIYIKDLFLRESENEWEQQRINAIAEQINAAYEYQIADLHEVVSALRQKGFLIDFIRPPQVERDKFEHLTISNDFQNLFNIGKIESWDDYIFPIDFYEILAAKPEHITSEDMHLYFMNRKEK
ncbi:MAG: class I SAM-dependent methyltransferase [Chitinophagales bacterium]|nr:class I SAM-dependent methyltransferase [Chitinophagales bacterium]